MYRKLLLVTPVFRRFHLTRLMLEHRVKTFEIAEQSGIKCQCVCIGDHENVELAEHLGFVGIKAENVLGAKYNDGHQFAVDSGYDVSFHCNSDQVFDPQLLVELANSPLNKPINTTWLTAVHPMGNRAVSYQDKDNWAMTAYPVNLLRKNPRPCEEGIMRLCDSSTRHGVLSASPELAGQSHTVEVGPLETIQFESGFQLTPWKNNYYRALKDGKNEYPVPWSSIAELHGQDLVNTMREFYGQCQ